MLLMQTGNAAQYFTFYEILYGMNCGRLLYIYIYIYIYTVYIPGCICIVCICVLNLLVDLCMSALTSGALHRGDSPSGFRPHQGRRKSNRLL